MSALRWIKWARLAARVNLHSSPLRPPASLILLHLCVPTHSLVNKRTSDRVNVRV